MSSKTNRIDSRKFTGDDADHVVKLGYKPMKVEIENVSTQTSYSKHRQMDTDKARKEIADGTKTFVAAVSIQDDGFTFIAAENTDTEEFHYTAYESLADRS